MADPTAGRRSYDAVNGGAGHHRAQRKRNTHAAYSDDAHNSAKFPDADPPAGTVFAKLACMPLLDVYIGQIEWPEQEPDSGHRGPTASPRRLSSSFPPPSGTRENPYFLVLRKIENGVFSGKQLAWGAWIARVRKGQIDELIDEIYAGDRIVRDPDYKPHLSAQLTQLHSCIESLEQDTEYALVANKL